MHPLQLFQWINYIYETAPWEWVFSGIGVFIISWSGRLLYRKRQRQDVTTVDSSALADQVISLYQQQLTSSGQREQSEILRILPAVDITYFTGREPELSQLSSLIFNDSHQSIIGLWGGPGVGKSALARHFAEEHTEQFPDGIIGLDARGKDANRLASDFAALISEPIDAESELEPSAIMQSRFARRRSLLIIDNAERADIRTLIPGGHCTMLVTTRDRDLLDHIGLRHEAQIRLSPFASNESLVFLQNLVGPQAVHDEEDAACELASLVGHLPLALRIAGASVRSQFLTNHPFIRYVTDLRNEQNRLQHLSWRDADELNILPVFRLSLVHLADGEHRTFACLAACVESGFNLETAAVTAAIDEKTAASHLSRLINLALLNVAPESRRFRFHPLIRLFAQHEAENELDVWDEARKRHASFFTGYVYEHQTLSQQSARDLEAEQDALLQTARWKIEHHDLDTVFWDGVCHLLESQGHWEVGIELMQDFTFANFADRCDLAHLHRQLGDTPSGSIRRGH